MWHARYWVHTPFEDTSIMRMLSKTIVFTLALTCAALFTDAVRAAPATTPGTERHAGQSARAASNVHKLASVAIDTGAPLSALVAGYNTIDTTKVVCGQPTCSIAVDMSTQVGANQTAGNQWASCAVVDGNYASDGCGYIGELPADSTYVSGSVRQTFAVTKGKHTVSVQIYVEAAATAGNYDVQYQVLTP
jgi:hypothetical protein